MSERKTFKLISRKLLIKRNFHIHHICTKTPENLSEWKAQELYLKAHSIPDERYVERWAEVQLQQQLKQWHDSHTHCMLDYAVAKEKNDWEKLNLNSPFAAPSTYLKALRYIIYTIQIILWFRSHRVVLSVCISLYLFAIRCELNFPPFAHSKENYEIKVFHSTGKFIFLF